MKTSLDMIGIITSQFDKMRAFYKDVMEMEILFEHDCKYVEFKHHGIRFSISTNEVLHEVTNHASYMQKKQGQSLELAFIVDNPEYVDTKYTKIVKSGATAIKGPSDMPWGQRAAFFADPDGNIHEIFANLPPKK